MVCEAFVEDLVGSLLFTTEVVPKIFPNLNVVGHLAVRAGWGSCLPRLAIFRYFLKDVTEGLFLIWKGNEFQRIGAK